MSRSLLLSAALAGALLSARAPWAADVGALSASAGARASELVAALEDYRRSLEALLPLQERELAGAIQRRERARDFFERGIISRKEFEQGEAAVAAASIKVEETRRAMAATDQAVSEATTVRALAGLRPLGPGGYERGAGLIRYNGAAVWSLGPDTVRLQHFFATRFGRTLPVSAYGQTPLHDRMGFDHRGALDVALHPDSPEGRALIDHLRAAGIPFIASWGAVPGSASGAHVHVGQPSPRIAATR